MQIIRTFIVACMLTLPAFAVSVVTGNVTDLGGNPAPGITVRFTLRGCKTQPRVVGTGVPVKLVKDMTSDATGHINDTIVRNDEITCQQLNDTFYEISLVPAVPDAQPLRTKINTGSFDISTAQDIAIATAPFTGLNVLLNPPASQTILQPPGTALGVTGDGYAMSQQGTTNAEHGYQLCNVNGSRCWRLGQVASTDLTYPGGSFILRTSDQLGNGLEDVLNCVQDGAGTGIPRCNLLNLWQAVANTQIDFTQASETAPVKTGTVLPGTCTANVDLFILTNGTGGQKLNICNATGNGWFLVGDGGAASSVTSFGGRQGDVLPAPGDYSSLSETLTNKVIDSSSNQIVSRAKLWLGGASCQGASAGILADTPTAGGVTATCNAGATNTELNIGSLTYVDGSTTTAEWSYSLPSDYVTSSSIDIRIHWMQSFSVGNPAQNVVWQAAITCPVNSSSIDTAWNTAQTATSASAAKLVAVDATITGLDATNCAGNNTMFVKVQRVGANGSDTMTGSAQLLGAEVTIVRNQ